MLNANVWSRVSEVEGKRAACGLKEGRPQYRCPFIRTWFQREPGGGNYAAVKCDPRTNAWYIRVVPGKLTHTTRTVEHIGEVLKNPGPIECPWCDGEGSVQTEGGGQDCRNCGGTGKGC